MSFLDAIVRFERRERLNDPRRWMLTTLPLTLVGLFSMSWWMPFPAGVAVFALCFCLSSVRWGILAHDRDRATDRLARAGLELRQKDPRQWYRGAIAGVILIPVGMLLFAGSLEMSLGYGAVMAQATIFYVWLGRAPRNGMVAGERNHAEAG